MNKDDLFTLTETGKELLKVSLRIVNGIATDDEMRDFKYRFDITEKQTYVLAAMISDENIVFGISRDNIAKRLNVSGTRIFSIIPVLRACLRKGLISIRTRTIDDEDMFFLNRTVVDKMVLEPKEREEEKEWLRNKRRQQRTDQEQNQDENNTDVVSIISHDNIPETDLIFNEGFRKEYDRVSLLLDPENFDKVQERLQEKKMNTGCNILLYGGPGTGKTESAKQWARATGRDLFLVELSQVRNRWMGESEKKLKAVFDKYNSDYELAQIEGRPAPILFFNEADGILGKRVTDTTEASDHVHNILQNVMLQAFEDCHGIYICTTNLATNMDSAIDRRFLFKIQFELPDAESRAKIWKSKMGDVLTDEQIDTLANSYEISGGQIDNVVRQNIGKYIISGENLDMSEIGKICESEMRGYRRKNKVGY